MRTLTPPGSLHAEVESPPRLDPPIDRAPYLYVGSVHHRRFGSVEHRFRFRLFYAYLDVDSLPEALDPLPLWSARRAAPVRFRRRDYLDGTDRPLGPAVRDLVEVRTGRRPTGPIRLLTQLRTAGWLFNPISVYYCFGPDGGALDAMVLEVTSTPWRERCWYVVAVDGDRPHGPWTFPKSMHVSPFLDMDLTYHLRAGRPAQRLDLHLEDRKDGRRLFAADLSLRRVPLDRRTALSVPARYPLLTWRISAAIYGHAARLWRKKAEVYRHPSRSSDGRRGEI